MVKMMDDDDYIEEDHGGDDDYDHDGDSNDDDYEDKFC